MEMEVFSGALPHAAAGALWRAEGFRFARWFVFPAALTPIRTWDRSRSII